MLKLFTNNTFLNEKHRRDVFPLLFDLVYKKNKELSSYYQIIDDVKSCDIVVFPIDYVKFLKFNSEFLELQNLANEGHVCIISAKHSNARRSGHMTIVPPEYKGFTREGAIPVQSQAGASNFKYKLGQNWYLNDRYSDFGFIVNRRPKGISFKGAQ